MEIDLRELMVYQSPPELGALYTEVEEMMKVMGKEQKILVVREMEKNEIAERRRKQKLHQLHINMGIGIGAILTAVFFTVLLSYVVEDRIKKYPQYGDGWIPKSEKQRKRESEPQVFIGR
jgi:hypothetical protein